MSSWVQSYQLRVIATINGEYGFFNITFKLFNMRKITILFIFMTIAMFCTVQSNNTKLTQKQQTTAIAHVGGYTATYYGNTYKTVRHTANGDVFDKNAMTCAAPKHYKFGTMLKVTNVNNGKSVTVRVNDRGGFGNRTIDLTHGAFGLLREAAVGNIGQWAQA